MEKYINIVDCISIRIQSLLGVCVLYLWERTHPVKNTSPAFAHTRS